MVNKTLITFWEIRYLRDTSLLIKIKTDMYNQTEPQPLFVSESSFCINENVLVQVDIFEYVLRVP